MEHMQVCHFSLSVRAEIWKKVCADYVVLSYKQLLSLPICLSLSLSLYACLSLSPSLPVSLSLCPSLNWIGGYAGLQG